MDYVIEIKKIISELEIDTEEQIKAEEISGPFNNIWIEEQKLKLQVKKDLQDIVDRLREHNLSVLHYLEE